jgi:isocitrate dehydrogenase
MKLTEGLLKRVFEEIAPEYPDIDARHIIVDNAAHQLVRRPEQFDIIVTTNMNGDILSDLTSGLIGGLGFAGSANVGADIAIFEAVHGSAPKYAGQDVANPTAMTLSAVMLLRHIGAVDVADQIEAAIHATLAAGIHTRDVQGGEPVGTVAYTDAVISRLDTPVEPSARKPLTIPTGAPMLATPTERAVVGMDVFVEFGGTAVELGPSIETLAEGSRFALKMISNRGTMVYPSSGTNPAVVDHFRCRFRVRGEGEPTDTEVLDLLARIGGAHRWNHVEKLQSFDGELGYTRAQGEEA